jgi:hypothetical protein
MALIGPLFSVVIKFPVLFAKPAIKLRDIFMQKGIKLKQGCTRKSIIGRNIRCVVRELNPAPCHAAYVSFGPKNYFYS